MAICGVDFSTRFIDIVLLDEETDAATWQRVSLGGQDAFDRARDVRAAMGMIPSAFWDEVLAVGIEDPRGYGAGSLYRIQGAILACLPRTVLVHPLIPSSWRKTVGLSGASSKEAVRVHVLALLYRASVLAGIPQPDWPQDACDAYCIALATRTLIQIGEAA